MPTRESIALERCGQRQARLAQEARKRLDEYVRRARLAGASWQAIGTALGTTRQSAWERFRSLCVYRKDQGIPERVLQVRHWQPHLFTAWVIDAARTDKNIEQWLEVPDIDLGRMANFSRAVAPIELLGSDVLRYFLMALDRDDKTQSSSAGRANCPVCNRMFQNKKFLSSHRKRAHGKPGARA